MSIDLRDAFHRAADAVPAMGDVERAVRSGRRRRRAATVAAPLAVLALVGGGWLVGAGSFGGDEPPVADYSLSPVTAADLAGRAFVTAEGPTDASILMFTSTELTVTAPTSRHTADYRLVENVLMLEPATNACGGPGCGSELLDLIQSRPTVSLAGAQLTLSGEERAVTLTESDVAEAGATLTGRTWGLQSIADGREFLALPGGLQQPWSSATAHSRSTTAATPAAERPPSPSPPSRSPRSAPARSAARRPSRALSGRFSRSCSTMDRSPMWSMATC